MPPDLHSIYAAFEDRFRGAPELIRKRQSIYLPLIEKIRPFEGGGRRALDIGCGRGEWLALIAENGWTGVGVDPNEGMLSRSPSPDVQFILGEGLVYLEGCPDHSFSLITAFHVVEHIPTDMLLQMLGEMLRVLAPDGMIILETPNPENLTVASWSFHMDPTHKAPIPPALLQYLVESSGFQGPAVFRLNGQTDTKSRLAQLFVGSPDYSVIAAKSENASPQIVEDIARFVTTGEARPAELPPLIKELEDMARSSESIDNVVSSLSTTTAAHEALKTFVSAAHETLKDSITAAHETLNDSNAATREALRKSTAAAYDDLGERMLEQASRIKKLEDLSRSSGAIESIAASLQAITTQVAMSEKVFEQASRITELEHAVGAISAFQAGLSDVNAGLGDTGLGPVVPDAGSTPTETLRPRVARRLSRLGRTLALGTRAWVTLRPGSRPRRVARAIIVRGYVWTETRPELRDAVKRFVPLIPPLDRRMRRMLTPPYYQPAVFNEAVITTQSYVERLASRRLLAAARLGRATQVDSPNSSDKPRLAYISPLPPERSGIADYSAVLIPALSAFYAIDVVCDQAAVDHDWIKAHCVVRTPAWFKENAGHFDRIVYHIGNSQFHTFMFSLLSEIPGVVVLHDFFLSNIMAHLELTGEVKGQWSDAVYHSHGYPALARRWNPNTISAAIDEFPASFKAIEQAQGIITHSHYAMDLCADFYPAHSRSRWNVIPLVRLAEPVRTRASAREAIGVRADDFVVCSFGYVQRTKLSDQLVEAWLLSGLAANPRCRLVFVGAISADAFGDWVSDRIRDPIFENRVSITGYAPPELYETYLQAADLGVQLRGFSRGETSAAVLDCLAHGVPIIVNANGSMNELPRDCVLCLADQFDTEALADALTSLFDDHETRLRMGASAKRFVAEDHAPAIVAARYRDAIEGFAASSPMLHDVRALMAHAGRLGIGSTAGERELHAGIADLLSGSPIERPHRQLLVDVSALVRKDLKTGIQRVVRAQLAELMKSPPSGYRVEPVWLRYDEEGWQYFYARDYMLRQFGLPIGLLPDEPVHVGEGDIFFGADLFPHGVVEARAARIYEGWRRRGALISFAVYDLLPLTMPQHFPPDADVSHGRWIDAVGDVAHVVVCISEAVADDVRRRFSEQGLNGPIVRSCGLGADIEASSPTTGLPDDAGSVLAQIWDNDSFLMVGTIEPRKGYLQAIAAFDELWRRGSDARLVIVGAVGWKQVPREDARTVPLIVETLTQHPELGRKLVWLEGLSDEYLGLIYRASTCLIAASEGEGYGLPLIEAARHKLPIIARDIPVFREVAGESVAFFTGDDGESLAQAIQAWQQIPRGSHATIDQTWSWAQNVDKLKDILLETKSVVQRKVEMA